MIKSVVAAFQICLFSDKFLVEAALVLCGNVFAAGVASVRRHQKLPPIPERAKFTQLQVKAATSQS